MHIRATLASRKLIVGWFLAIALGTVGFLPIVVTPLVGDDTVVLASGIAQLRDITQVPGYFLDSILVSISSAHVLPFGGAFTSLYVSVAYVPTFLGIPPSLSWGIIRIATIIFALWALAYAAIKVLQSQGLLNSPSQRRWAHLSLFSAGLGTVIATAQIHALWSQDPMLAYAIAAWLTPALLGLTIALSAVYIGDARSRPGVFVAVVALGGVGVFTYEPFVVGWLASLIPLLALRAPAVSVQVRRLRKLLLSAAQAMILLLWVGSQLWRMAQPQTYDGTSVGFAQMVIPTWINGLLSSVPLTNATLTQELASDAPINSLVVIIATTAAVALVAGGLYARRNFPVLSAKAIAPFVSFLILYAVGVIGLYSLSTKYQMELGNRVGSVYLFYAVALVASALVISLCITFLRVRYRGVTVAVLSLLFLIAVLQWSLNSKSLAELNSDWAWTSSFVNSLVEVTPEDERCDLVRNFSAPWMSDNVRRALSEAMESVYMDSPEGTYCSNVEALVEEQLK